jgi:hypothetical protein
MYKPDNERIKKYILSSGEAEHFDWHAWLRDLSSAEREELRSEVLAAGSRSELSDYARQYYLHFCTDTEDEGLRAIEHDFVMAQMEDKPAQEIAETEDAYFQRAKELLRLQENDSDGN